MLAFPQAYISIAETKKIAAPGVPQIASNYIKKNLPQTSTIVADTYYLQSSKHDIRTPRINLYKQSITQYRENGVDYLLVKPKRLHFARQQPELYPFIIIFFNELEKEAKIIKTFNQSCSSVNDHKRDYMVYKWIWTKGLSNFGNFCKGEQLVLYKIKLDKN